MSAAWARDVARGIGYAFATFATLVAVLAAGAPHTLADAMPDARVSSVVGARMDNFNPDAALDTSQIERGASMGGEL